MVAVDPCEQSSCARVLERQLLPSFPNRFDITQYLVADRAVGCSHDTVTGDVVRETVPVGVCVLIDVDDIRCRIQTGLHDEIDLVILLSVAVGVLAQVSERIDEEALRVPDPLHVVIGS